MNIKRLLYSTYSKILISILLGFGIATFFRKSCNSRNCLNFISPNMKKVKDKVYEFDDKYYKFTPKSTKCDNNNNNKKIISFS